MDVIGEIIYAMIAEFLGAGTRSIFFRLWGRKQGWAYYLSDEYNAVNALVGTLVFLVIVGLVLFLIFIL